MSRLQLKIIVCIAMTADHMAFLFFDSLSPVYTVLRSIGRIAFPLVCYLLVEGYLHTKNFRRYVLRMAGFALFSEVPYFYFFARQLNQFQMLRGSYSDEAWAALSEEVQQRFAERYLAVLNVLFTLCVCLLLLRLYEKIQKKCKYQKTTQFYALCTLSFIGSFFITVFLQMDYYLLAPLLVTAIYFMKENKPMLAMVLAFVVVCFSGSVAYGVGGLAAALLLMRYRGEAGKNGEKRKYFFYVYYPLHLAVLLVIRYALFPALGWM